MSHRILRTLAFVVVAASAACFAPPPLAGLAAGDACSTDLDCDDGLVCECGFCGEPSEPRLPPACEVDVDNRCPPTPSSCFAECGVEVVVGIAGCVNGRETCADGPGVLREDCPADTCWGEPEAGEVCIDGVFECAFGRNGPTGLCYTFDCEGEAELCVLDCSASQMTAQVCVGSTWRCELGFPMRQCGGCVGTAPPCVESCADPFPDGTATCVEDAWTCDGELQSACCLDGPTAPITSLDALVALVDETCVTESVQLVGVDDIADVALPNLRRAGGLLLVGTSVESLSMPLLRHVDDDVALSANANLSALDLGALRTIGGDLNLTSLPLVDTCAIAELVVNVTENGTLGGSLTIDVPLDADAGCALPVDDAGVADGGDVDAGAPDAGVDDAGTLDAGVDDAGTLDAGTLDAGTADAGTLDAGGVDAGAVDAG